MSVRVAFLALPLLACITGSALAKPLSEKQVTAGKVALDPSQGYIFISGGRQMGVFLRVPDAETMQAWRQDRDKALASAKRRYAQELATWKVYADHAKQSAREAPPKPEEPTYTDLAVVPAELRDVESFGLLNAYTKDPNATYFNQVKPGTYIWFGRILAAPNAVTGACYCMGTVQFEVKPGVITNLGNTLFSLPRFKDQMDVGRAELLQLDAKRVAAGKPPLDPASYPAPDFALPASLASWPSVNVAYRASAKINNFYGVSVTRLPPIPGVLSYRRDTVIDASTGQEVPSPTLFSRQKIKK